MARAPRIKDEPYFVMEKWPQGHEFVGSGTYTIDGQSVSKPRNRGGRPSLDPIDDVLIGAIRRAAQAGGLKVSSLILINVRVGLILGASQEATLKRLQSKAKRKGT